MSFSGSPDSERSTNSTCGLADTDSDCTALRRPPLLIFSTDQPTSEAIGRIASAVVSSHTKAHNGSSVPGRAGLQGAYRSEKRRVGKECVRRCRYRGSAHTQTKIVQLHNMQKTQ